MGLEPQCMNVCRFENQISSRLDAIRMLVRFALEQWPGEGQADGEK